MDPIRGVLQAISLGSLSATRAVRPIQPVVPSDEGEIMLQPDTYEPGTREAPMPQVTYTARPRAR